MHQPPRTSVGYLAKALGRKTFFLLSLALFTLASVLCGLSWNLQSLLLFRLLQGLGGGGMVPVSQSILADAFPPEKRGQGFALWGIAVVAAPVVGPTLGGWLSDNYSWTWCFLINAPVGFATIALISAILPEPKKSRTERSLDFDLVGFLLVATFLGALELVLDRGQQDDWFGSGFIVTSALVCALAGILMIPWELSRPEPMIDMRMLATRQFATSLIVMLSAGAILLSTTQFVPQLVQQNFGYTATWAGLALSPGGLVTMVMMMVAGRLSGVVQPKYLIVAGAVIVAASMYQMTAIYGDLSFWFFARSRMLLALGLPLIILPIISASYGGLPPGKTDQASALLNVARNTGSSIGIALVSNVLAHREQFHQSRLIEHVVQSSTQYQITLQQITRYFLDHGSSALQAQQQATGWIAQQVQQQATFLAYVDAFWVLMLIGLSVVPLALMLRNVKLGAAQMGH